MVTVQHCHSPFVSWAGSLKYFMKQGPVQDLSDFQPQQEVDAWVPQQSLHLTVSSAIQVELTGKKKSHQLSLEIVSLIFSFPFGCLLK